MSLVSLTYLKKLASRTTLYWWMMVLLFNLETCYKRNGAKSWLFCWFLSSLFNNHEYAYTCILLSFIWKWNKNRFEPVETWWMVQFLIIYFPQNICGCGYYIIRLLCRNYTSQHCSMLSTHCNKVIVHSIRYLTWVAFLSA